MKAGYYSNYLVILNVYFSPLLLDLILDGQEPFNEAEDEQMNNLNQSPRTWQANKPTARPVSSQICKNFTTSTNNLHGDHKISVRKNPSLNQSDIIYYEVPS